MKKQKRGLSRFLALAMTVSLLSPPGMPVFASASQGMPEGMRSTAVSDMPKKASGSEAVRDEELPKETEASGDHEMAGAEESKEQGDEKEEAVEYSKREEEKKATRANALTGAVSEVQLDVGELEVQDEMAMTLLPITEVDAYLMLNGYSEEQIKAMPVDTMLSLLKDFDGVSIEISENAEKVWTFFENDDGITTDGKCYSIGSGETIDLSKNEQIRRYEMELIVGSGNQLDLDNVRYNVTVYITDTFEDWIDYSLCIEHQAYLRDFLKKSVRPSNILSDIGIPVTSVIFEDMYDDEYYLAIYSDVAKERKDIQIDVYPMTKFLQYYQNGAPLDGAITDEILNLSDMMFYGGFHGTYQEQDSLEEYLNAGNMFCIVYKDISTDKVIAYQGLLVTVQSSIKGGFFVYENGCMEDVTDYYCLIHSSRQGESGNHWDIKLGTETNGVTVDYGSGLGSYKLRYGYSPDLEYYYVLYPNDILHPTDHIEKVVRGSFGSRDEAEKAGAEDITDQILPDDTSHRPYGYRAKYSQSVDFTIFFDDGSSCQYRVSICDDSSDDIDITEYDEAPYVKGLDPYFRVYEEPDYVCYGPQDGLGIMSDTLYAYGYQTLLIPDESADLSHIKPTFWCADNVRIHAGEEQKSDITEQDFSKGTVQYTASIGDNVKNYFVTFKKKENGPKLFVNGPSKREVFLDEYFENRHDILIANIGNEVLTGLSVELLNAVNVKLDDYWTVGGEKNDTLSPFVQAYGGGLLNLAKIRLLPAGEGTVSGTLKISADGQEDVYIELTGYAGNPKIATESLSDAVKYVPYSYVVATNNIHGWNRVTFSLEEGKLPDGLQLYPATGEIYGVPLETGEFPIKVKASYSREEFTPSYAEFVLTVKENTNGNVYFASDEGYELIEHIGTEAAAGTYDYVVNSVEDQLFVSAGEYGKFIDLWLNGEKLVENEDYTKESGSTRITVKSQTFQKKTKSGSNTIAAEFRESDESRELKRTAQNFRISVSKPGNDNQTPNDDKKPEGNEEPDNGQQPDNNPGSDNPPNSNDIPPDSDGSIDSSNNSRRTERRRDRDNYSIDPNLDITRYHDDSWVKDDIGWRCKKPDGSWITNTWFQLPYQGTVEWYYFNEQGYMATGLLEYNGLLYYLNPISDGTQGKMVTGWQIIDGNWYYFKEVSDGTKGAMMSDIWIGEYYLDPRGVWIEEEGAF